MPHTSLRACVRACVRACMCNMGVGVGASAGLSFSLSLVLSLSLSLSLPSPSPPHTHTHTHTHTTGMQALRGDNRHAAVEYFQRAVDVTPLMAHRCIKVQHIETSLETHVLATEALRHASKLATHELMSQRSIKLLHCLCKPMCACVHTHLQALTG